MPTAPSGLSVQDLLQLQKNQGVSLFPAVFLATNCAEHDPSSQPLCVVSREQLLRASTTWGDETSSVMEMIVPLCLGSRQMSFFEIQRLFQSRASLAGMGRSFPGTMETSSCITLTVTGRRSCWKEPKIPLLLLNTKRQ